MESSMPLKNLYFSECNILMIKKKSSEELEINLLMTIRVIPLTRLELKESPENQ